MRRPENTPALPFPRGLLLAALLVGAGCAAYLPILHAGFVWDDDTFLTANPLIRAPDGLRRFWLTTQAADYWPVTSSSLWLEWRLWGLHAGGYHATNLVLHLGECLLLWSVLRRLALPGAYLAALLFALHPVNVESVAWIAQRKNLLALLFFLLSIHAFLRTLPAERPLAGRAPPWGGKWYALSLGAFALGLLSKGSVAPLPLVLLLLLWWKGRWSLRQLPRLLPFFLLSAALVLVDIWFQRHGGARPVRVMGGSERVLGAGTAVWFYLGKALWPGNLSFIYPTWPLASGRILGWLPFGAALGVTAVLGSCRQRAWGRPAWFGWAYYAVMLLPVLGLVDVYFLRYAPVADHYQHLALMAVTAAAAGLWALWQSRTPGALPFAAAAAAAAVLGCLTFAQARNYADAETLYRATLDRNPGAWLAENNLGVILLDRGQTDEALARFQTALRLKPDYAEAHIGLGHARLNRGETAAAAAEFQTALALGSDFDREAHLDLGHAWFQLGRAEAAAAEYRQALHLDSGYAEAHYSLGNVLFSQGRFPAAVAEYRQALRTDPADAELRNNLGSALVRAGQPAAAVTEYERALQLRPGDSSILANLARARSALGTGVGQQ